MHLIVIIFARADGQDGVKRGSRVPIAVHQSLSQMMSLKVKILLFITVFRVFKKISFGNVAGLMSW
jgi:hypothetical protein